MNPALALLLLLGVGAAQASMPVDRLRAAAEAAAPFSPATASLDPRVQVARCSGPLLTELTSVQQRLQSTPPAEMAQVMSELAPVMGRMACMGTCFRQYQACDGAAP